MNNRGFAELIVIFVFVFVIGILFYFALHILNGYNSMSAGNPEATVVNNSTNGTASGFDIAMVVIVGLLFVGAIITAIVVEVHPIFIWLGIIVFVLVAYSISQFGQVTPQIINNSTLPQEVNQTPKANAVLQNLPLIIVGLGVIFFIALYAKMRSRAGP